jgi:hypothetical protein
MGTPIDPCGPGNQLRGFDSEVPEGQNVYSHKIDKFSTAHLWAAELISLLAELGLIFDPVFYKHFAALRPVSGYARKLLQFRLISIS